MTKIPTSIVFCLFFISLLSGRAHAQSRTERYANSDSVLRLALPAEYKLVSISHISGNVCGCVRKSFIAVENTEIIFFYKLLEGKRYKRTNLEISDFKGATLGPMTVINRNTKEYLRLTYRPAETQLLQIQLPRKDAILLIARKVL